MKNDIIELIHNSFKKRKPKHISQLYKQWLMYLKNKKLFDEYMIYMNSIYGDESIYPTPKTEDYEILHILVRSINIGGIIFSNATIHIDWEEEFKAFVEHNTKWWQFLTRIKFLH